MQRSWILYARYAKKTEQMNDADDKLFYSTSGNHHRVLQHFVVDNPDTVYNLRPRKPNKTLVTKTAQLNNLNFLMCHCV